MKRIICVLMPTVFLIGCSKSSAPTPAVKVAKHSETSKKQIDEPATKKDPVAQTTRREDELEKKSPPTEVLISQEPKEEPPLPAPPIPESFKPLNKEKNVFFEKTDSGRRVHLLANVCLREGPLEMFLCKKNTKEHESILNIDLSSAREIHFALIAAGAVAGSPTKFVPMFQGASGSKIKVTLTYRENGKVKTVAAQEWIKDKKTNKSMGYDWVFAGSSFFSDPERPNAPQYYMADNGEIISLSNFQNSMMDLPVKSPSEAAALIYEIDSAKIPPVGTPVVVTLEPVLEKK